MQFLFSLITCLYFMSFYYFLNVIFKNNFIKSIRFWITNFRIYLHPNINTGASIYHLFYSTSYQKASRWLHSLKAKWNFEHLIPHPYKMFVPNFFPSPNTFHQNNTLTGTLKDRIIPKTHPLVILVLRVLEKSSYTPHSEVVHMYSTRRRRIISSDCLLQLSNMQEDQRGKQMSPSATDIPHIC